MSPERHDKNEERQHDPNWDVLTMNKRRLQYQAVADADTPPGYYWGKDPANKMPYVVLNRQFLPLMHFLAEVEVKAVFGDVLARLNAGEKISVAAAIKASAKTRWPARYGTSTSAKTSLKEVLKQGGVGLSQTREGLVFKLTPVAAIRSMKLLLQAGDPAITQAMVDAAIAALTDQERIELKALETPKK